MEFSSEQEQALDKVLQWFKARDKQIFRLFGWAGTGKTTLAKYFSEHITGRVQFAAFTGKAAQVLRKKGAENARTIHSLIYSPRGEEEMEDQQTGKMSLAPKFVLNMNSPISDAQLIIIDECSMVDEKLGRDLMSFGKPILVLGDPGQLPPVSGGGFFTNENPDFILEEIFRQARDNPILKFAADIRAGKKWDYGDYGALRIIPKTEMTAKLALEADQVLLGINRTRTLYNKRLRELKGFTDDLPQSGDKLVCLRNDPNKGLMNGSLWRVLTASKSSGKLNTRLIITPEDEERGAAKIKLLKKFFQDPNAQISWQEKKRYDEFDFGYVLTVHKSQGSQWDNVLLFDESYAFKDMRMRWLYTGITRASKTLTFVQ